jgi:ParB family chromosome partitioning protein
MKTTPEKNLKLGKGMAALFGQNASVVTNEIARENNKLIEQPSMLPIEFVQPNKNQPRKIFSETELRELSESIKENGIIQPIIVQRIADNKFEIIAGERRYRAAKMVGLEHVPVVIKTVTNKDKLVMAIIENVQRSDLNCVEEALSYFQLMDEFKLTQEEVAKKIGKDRSTIANHLRILKLPREVLGYIQKNLLSFGHAKVLAALKDDEIIKRHAQQAVAENLSVRELEKLIKQRPVIGREKNEKNKFFDAKIDTYRQKLEQKTGYHFNIASKKNGAGELRIKYNNEAEFNDIFNFFMK